MPVSCYWAIVVGVFWGLLVVTAPAGYKIVGAEYISRHLYFNIVEVTALCLQLVRDIENNENTSAELATSFLAFLRGSHSDLC